MLLTRRVNVVRVVGVAADVGRSLGEALFDCDARLIWFDFSPIKFFSSELKSKLLRCRADEELGLLELGFEPGVDNEVAAVPPGLES